MALKRRRREPASHFEWLDAFILDRIVVCLGEGTWARLGIAARRFAHRIDSVLALPPHSADETWATRVRYSWQRRQPPRFYVAAGERCGMAHTETGVQVWGQHELLAACARPSLWLRDPPRRVVKVVVSRSVIYLLDGTGALHCMYKRSVWHRVYTNVRTFGVSLKYVRVSDVFGESVVGGHVIILMRDNTIHMLGKDGGTLGTGAIGTTEHVMRVVMTNIQDRIVDVEAGYAHSLIVTAGGSVYTYGRALSLLGYGRDVRTNSFRPRLVTGLPPVSAVSATMHTLALTRSGDVYSWGHEDGIGRSCADYAWMQPGKVPLPERARAVATGYEMSAVVGLSGRVYTFGNRMSAPKIPSIPKVIPDRVVAVRMGDDFAVAATITGKWYAWGVNDRGQLGIPTETGAVL